MSRRALAFSHVLLLFLVAVPCTHAQVIVINPERDRILPPDRRPTPSRGDYEIASVDVQADIRDQSARVQVSQVFANKSSRMLQATMLFPLPDEASISGLTLIVDGKEMPGKILPKDQARQIYERIVSRSQDPALLEYMGRGLFRTSVFPVPAGAERKVEIRYTQLLKQRDGLVDFSLPLGHSKHSTKPIRELNLTLRVSATTPIKNIYSPSHEVKIERPSSTRAICKATLTDVLAADDFRLLYGSERGPVGMNLLSYRPDKGEDGYFLLLAAPEIKDSKTDPLPKSVIFVVDRSGSMSGEKFEQVRGALRFVLDRLHPSDTFNIVAYDADVEAFRPELQRADEETLKQARGFVDGLYAGGSTNIDGALQTSLSMLTDTSRPAYVLFLTDGLPTAGESNEVKIAARAKEANKVGARVFNFGVGFDVNSRLLDRLSRDQRGQSIYVRPNEDIEAQVAMFYNRIGAPMMTDIAVDFDFKKYLAPNAASPIARTYPRQLTDLFRGEQLVWVGRYRHAGTVTVKLSGSIGGKQQTFEFPSQLVDHSADESNGFVEKLWATRRVGEILDDLDLNGDNKELVDELVKLSIQHGIMTPYTSFLAEETTDLVAQEDNTRRTELGIRRRLGKETSGRSAFNQRQGKSSLQRANRAKQTFGGSGLGGGGFGGGGGFSDAQSVLRNRGRMRAGKLKGAKSPGTEDRVLGMYGLSEDALLSQKVRNIGQKTFFLRKGQWRDSTVTPQQEKKAIRIVQFSREYFDLAAEHGGTLAKYLAFQEPVLLNLGEKTYQIDPPNQKKQKG